MAKRTITNWWIFGAAALGLAAILIIADAMALADHLAALPAKTQLGLTPDDFSRKAMVLIALGGCTAAIGILAELVAWVGALMNSRQLADRSWFNAILSSGVIGLLALPLFGLGALVGGSAMLAYLVAGPDLPAIGRTHGASARPTIWSKPTIRRWSTWGLAPLGAGPVIALAVSNQTNAGGLLHGDTWLALVLLATCAVIAVCGVIVESVAWWAAVFNARRLADKTWYTLLVWSGVVATLTMPFLGLGALIAAGVGIAYRQAAPDVLADAKPTNNELPETA